MTAPVLLLDTASLYFRAFYGVPDSVRASDGTVVNAARGLLEMITRLHITYEPSRIIACWDDDWRPQWRVNLLPSYKAHRVANPAPDGPSGEDVPDLLAAQIPLIREELTLLGIPIIGAADHEADDVIGTLATGHFPAVDIITGDRDLFQLIDDDAHVRVIYTGRGMSNLEVLTEASIAAKYGVLPRQYVDFSVMRGDASDGLPGVAGIGEKTAAGLLATHGTLDAIRHAGTNGGAGMSASIRAKLATASDYLDVAPTVVAVVRNLELDVPPAVPANTEAATSFAAQWSLTTAMQRAVAALTSASA